MYYDNGKDYDEFTAELVAVFKRDPEVNFELNPVLEVLNGKMLQYATEFDELITRRKNGPEKVLTRLQKVVDDISRHCEFDINMGLNSKSLLLIQSFKFILSFKIIIQKLVEGNLMPYFYSSRCSSKSALL